MKNCDEAKGRGGRGRCEEKGGGFKEEIERKEVERDGGESGEKKGMKKEVKGEKLEEKMWGGERRRIWKWK